MDPLNHGNNVRIMEGNPNSQYAHQQVSYVRWNRHGQSLDAAGNIVEKFTPAARIPYSSVIFLPEVFQ